MPKIPRVDLSPISGSVPSGGLGGGAGVTAGFDSAGKLLDVGYNIASDAAKTEAVKLQRALEAKQTIVNEVEAGRRAGDFEEDLVGYSDKMKEQFWDQPDKAPEQLQMVGRQLADRQLEQAPNSEVGKELAQRTNARVDAAVREMHTWARERQTQKAKGDLSIIVNRATAAAENAGSTESLGALIKAKEAELTPMFQKVLGAGEAEKQMAEMRSGMARSWAIAVSERSPIGVMQALASTKAGSPLVDYLNVSQREELRKQAKSSFEGMERTRELDVIKKGITDNRTLYDAFAAGAPNLGGAMYAQRKSIDEQRHAVKAQISVDDAALRKLGIEPNGKTKEDLLATLDAREEFVVALDRAHRRQIGFEAEDNPAEVEGLLVAVDKALKAKKGKDLTAIVKQQAGVAGALADKKISYGTAATMFKTMALALDTAASNNEDVWGPNTLRLWRAPMESGAVELNRQFDGPYKKLDKTVQNRIRLSYMGQFNAAQSQGANVSVESARQMALRALALETGDHVPGVK